MKMRWQAEIEDLATSHGWCGDEPQAEPSVDVGPLTGDPVLLEKLLNQHGIRVYLADSQGWWVEGTVIALTASGTRLWLTDMGARYSAPQEVNLYLTSSVHEIELYAGSHVLNWCEVDGGWIYEFRWANPGSLIAGFPKEIQRMLNRRDAFRVEPGMLVAVEVMCGETFSAQTGTLDDISPTGISVLVPSLPFGKEDRDDPRPVCYRFSLPGENRDINLKAKVVEVLEVEEGYRLSCRFDLANTPLFRRVESAIHQFVMRQQRDNLRTRREQREQE